MTMLNLASMTLPDGSRNRSRPGAGVPPMRAAVTPGAESQRDAAFIALLNAYRTTGGLMRGEDLAGLQIARGSGDLSSLARSIVSGEILCFDWNQTIWVPAFQLDRDSLTPGSSMRRVLAELSGAFDGWSAAHWFVAPNARLRECTPIELLGAQLEAVLDAARADCVIAWTCAGIRPADGPADCQ